MKTTAYVEKKLHMEVIRVFAILLVFFNHTDEVGYTLFVTKTDSVMRPIYLFLSDICVIAVPLFFMISGALLLGKEESYKELFAKRVLRIVIALIISSIAYNVYYYVMWDNPFDLWKIICKLPFSWAYFSQWYLYSYLAFLVMLPILRKTVISMQVKDYIYVIICNILIVGVLPMATYVLSSGQKEILSYFEPTMIMTECIVYSLTGYFIERVIPADVKEKAGIEKINIILALMILSFVALYITGKFVIFKYALLGTMDGNWLSGTQKMLALIPAVTVYVMVKCFFEERTVKPVTSKVIAAAGSSVFGVFLIEGILRESTFGIYGKLYPVIGILPACLIWILTAVVIGIVVIWLIKKIPYVSKVI